MKLTDALKSQCLSFVYYGGSTPGSKRQVRVEEVYDDSILAYDLDKMATRRFLNREASHVQLIPVMPTPPNTVEKRIGFDDVRRELRSQIDSLTAEELTQACKSAGLCEDATFDSNTGEVVMAVAKPQAHLSYGDDCHIVITNADGNEMTVHFWPSNQNGQQITINGTYVEPQEFSEILSTHLDN
jgi:hypothetical protein